MLNRSVLKTTQDIRSYCVDENSSPEQLWAQTFDVVKRAHTATVHGGKPLDINTYNDNKDYFWRSLSHELKALTKGT